ncbi:MAG: VCBS domain-containing protein [Candidatus Margulisbacteria bacterium]|nr:VCBS domain-containing protein [Candidatus Margulisiibacteriota bacterium]MBU1022413.1 VCBS domain-containing protein [Candidatus Margulisiibacteriota bacterium]MBU1729035.1 VCBS domain-containing protein [Candidatus Margulisiibacteriota bacterium]MBU1954544.1 VCBS domain-containing protein [Candidatus Margulisiibacteriota bacterium]
MVNRLKNFIFLLLIFTFIVSFAGSACAINITQTPPNQNDLVEDSLINSYHEKIIVDEQAVFTLVKAPVGFTLTPDVLGTGANLDWTPTNKYVTHGHWGGGPDNEIVIEATGVITGTTVQHTILLGVYNNNPVFYSTNPYLVQDWPTGVPLTINSFDNDDEGDLAERQTDPANSPFYKADPFIGSPSSAWSTVIDKEIGIVKLGCDVVGSVKYNIVAFDGVGSEATFDPWTTYTEYTLKVEFAQNQPPVADNQTVTINEGDTNIQITLTGYDVWPFGIPITFYSQVLNLPSGATLTPDANFKDNGIIYYDPPNTDWNGTDTFNFKVFDGGLFSQPGIVTVQVLPINDAPVAVDDTYAVDEGATITVFPINGVLSNDTDVDNNIIQLNAVLVDDVDHGLLNFNSNNGSFVYEHDGSETLSDTFTYKANDGQDDSNVATVTITINPINDAPTADAGPDQNSYSASLVTLDGSGSSDVDGDPLSYIWINAHGITLDDIYAVNPTFTAPEVTAPTTYTFTLTVTDPSGLIDSDEVDITISEAPDSIAPIINATVNGTLGDNNWYVSEITIDMEAEDPDSGIAKIVYWANSDAPTEVYTTTASDVIAVDGSHTFSCYAVDNVGNTSATVLIEDLHIDTAPPEITDVKLEDTYLAESGTVDFGAVIPGVYPQLSASVSDVMSGVAEDEICISFNGSDLSLSASEVTGIVGMGTAYELSSTSSGLGVGTNEFEIVARDLAGNETTYNARVNAEALITYGYIYPNPWHLDIPLSITFGISEAKDVTVHIYDEVSRLRKVLNYSAVAGNNTFTWSDDVGLGNGLYPFKVFTTADKQILFTGKLVVVRR